MMIRNDVEKAAFSLLIFTTWWACLVGCQRSFDGRESLEPSLEVQITAKSEDTRQALRGATVSFYEDTQWNFQEDILEPFVDNLVLLGISTTSSDGSVLKKIVSKGDFWRCVVIVRHPKFSPASLDLIMDGRDKNEVIFVGRREKRDVLVVNRRGHPQAELPIFVGYSEGGIWHASKTDREGKIKISDIPISTAGSLCVVARIRPEYWCVAEEETNEITMIPQFVIEDRQVLLTYKFLELPQSNLRNISVNIRQGVGNSELPLFAMRRFEHEEWTSIPLSNVNWAEEDRIQIKSGISWSKGAKRLQLELQPGGLNLEHMIAKLEPSLMLDGLGLVGVQVSESVFDLYQLKSVDLFAKVVKEKSSLWRSELQGLGTIVRGESFEALLPFGKIELVLEPPSSEHIHRPIAFKGFGTEVDITSATQEILLKEK